MARCCKRTGQSADRSPAGNSRRLAAKAVSGLRWILPATVLAIMPKCPVCFAAYLAIATGLGISVTAAAYLRGGLILASAAALIALAVGLARRYLIKHRITNVR